jgi:hypothetical protein
MASDNKNRINARQVCQGGFCGAESSRPQLEVSLAMLPKHTKDQSSRLAGWLSACRRMSSLCGRQMTTEPRVRVRGTLCLLVLRLENCLNDEEGLFWDVTPCGSCKNRCFEGI